jgi:hypothetical protein
MSLSHANKGLKHAHSLSIFADLWVHPQVLIVLFQDQLGLLVHVRFEDSLDKIYVIAQLFCAPQLLLIGLAVLSDTGSVQYEVSLLHIILNVMLI